jgi:hypothetical protein
MGGLMGNTFFLIYNICGLSSCFIFFT